MVDFCNIQRGREPEVPAIDQLSFNINIMAEGHLISQEIMKHSLP